MRMVRLAEPCNPRRRAEMCIACAVKVAIDNGSDEREAFAEIDALFTVMTEQYFTFIAHDEQSNRG